MSSTETPPATWNGNEKPLTAASATMFAILGFVAAALLFRRILATGARDTVAAESLEFTMWTTLAAIMTVVYFLMFLFSWSQIWTTWTTRLTFRRRVVMLLAYAAMASAVVLLLRTVLPEEAAASPVNSEPIAIFMPIWGVLMAMPTVFGLWLVHPRLRAASFDEERRNQSVLDLRHIRTDLGRYLGVISLFVSLAVIGTGALRNALLAHGWKEEQFPASHVLLYGAFFTAILLAIYIPVFLAWRSAAAKFIDTVSPLPNAILPDEAWEADRTRLATYLGTDTKLSDHLNAAFGILAPLATSVIAVFVTQLADK